VALFADLERSLLAPGQRESRQLSDRGKSVHL
jgi:hypothetical protein